MCFLNLLLALCSIESLFQVLYLLSFFLLSRYRLFLFFPKDKKRNFTPYGYNFPHALKVFSVLAWITPWTIDSDEETGGGGLSVAHLLQQVSDNLLPHCAARYGSHVNPFTSFIQLKCCLRLVFGIRGHANWAVAVVCLVLSNDYCGFSISVSSPLSQPSRGTVLENQKQPKSLKHSVASQRWFPHTVAQ